MNKEFLIPDSIATEHIAVFDKLIKSRLSNIELEQLLVYMIETINPVALKPLAEQFNVMGYGGWKLADTDEKKRALIKKAIELHRFKGTIRAIREALKTVGFPDAQITEHVGHWAGFTIQLGVGDNVVNADQIADALEMVKAYKNVRSHLAGFTFEIRVDDTITITDDSFEAPKDVLEDSLFTGGNLLYDGASSYDGNHNYSSDSDVLELTITHL